MIGPAPIIRIEEMSVRLGILFRHPEVAALAALEGCTARAVALRGSLRSHLRVTAKLGVRAHKKRARDRASLKHDPEKWLPVFRKDHAPPTRPKRQGLSPRGRSLD